MLESLFDSSDFPARWHCGNWTAPHGWTHIVSDVLIFGAYVAIPLVLSALVLRRRGDMPFPRVFWLFAAFILACGTTHLIESIIFWNPVYRLSALVKAITAAVSWATVVALVPTVRQALKLSSPEKLKRIVESRTRELDAQRAQLAQLNAELSARNEEMRQFVYTVSHDLKSPLVTAVGFTSVLRKSLEAGDTEQANDALDRLARSTSRMSALIADLLQLSRVGFVESELVPTDLTAVVNAARMTVATELEEVGGRIEIDDLPTIPCDAVRLQQVFENLLGNAIKYRDRGRDLEIRVTVQERDDATMVSVRDNGIGIDPAHHQRVFGIFERLDPNAEGTGVGLAIVKRIMALHGGDAWVESTLGEGSTFHLTFPRGQAEHG